MIEFPTRPSQKEGWVYAIQLVPDIDENRIKIGFTAGTIQWRLKSFRTTCPTLQLAGWWEACARDEALLLDKLRKTERRIENSEVFQCSDLAVTLEAIDRYFSETKILPGREWELRVPIGELPWAIRRFLVGDGSVVVEPMEKNKALGHRRCPPSRRGHTWHELRGTLRKCARCGALGLVDKQGIVRLLDVKPAEARAQ